VKHGAINYICLAIIAYVAGEKMPRTQSLRRIRNDEFGTEHLERNRVIAAHLTKAKLKGGTTEFLATCLNICGTDNPAILTVCAGPKNTSITDGPRGRNIIAEKREELVC
jgi:hypothetical protein